jgi:cobalamin biosynthesis Mg chelatase CobN
LQSSTEAFGAYREAILALLQVEERETASIRQATASAAAVEARARGQLAEQQQVFSQAAREADEAQLLVDQVRSTLRLPVPTPLGATASRGGRSRLVEVRAEIRGVADWARDSNTRAESLMRSLNRLARQVPAEPPLRTDDPPLPVEAVEARASTGSRSRSVPTIVGLLALVVALAVIAAFFIIR